MTKESKTLDIIKQLSAQASVPVSRFPLKSSFAGLLVASFVYLILMLNLFYGIRADFLDKINSADFVMELVTVALLILTTYSLSIYYATPREPYKALQKWSIITLFIALCFLVLGFSEGNIMNITLNFKQLNCFTDVVIFALPTTIAGFLILKKNATTNPEWLGFTILLLAATIGYLGIRLSCAAEAFDHQAFTHLLPVALYTLTGYILGRKILNW